MFGRRSHRGLIKDFASRNGMVRAHTQVFQQLCQELKEPHRKLCAITSSSPGEGRTSLAINLALVAAREAEDPVLLIDADTESPSLHLPFGLTKGPGLFDLIAGKAELDDALRKPKSNTATAQLGPQLERITILTTGDAPTSAVTLAESRRSQSLMDDLRARFGWIFADTAALVSAPGMTAFDGRADGVILAVRWSATRAQLITHAVQQLDEAEANTIGVVLTQRHFVIPNYVYRRL